MVPSDLYFDVLQEQFKFIYDTLEESITCGWSWFPVSELTTRLKQKSIKYPVTKLNEYQREYAVRLSTVLLIQRRAVQYKYRC